MNNIANTQNIKRKKTSLSNQKVILYWFTVFFLCTIYAGKAQTPQKNLEKYWFYRQRLQEHFIYHTNNPMDHGTNQPAQGVKVYQTPEGIKTTAEWVDGVWWLGHYIGMLAMEYKLLKDNNQPYEITLIDLKNALLAFKRLDENAEPYFGGQSSINGFYLRDDVPNDSLASKQLQVDQMSSSYVRSRGIIFGDSPSHDQAWSMSVGLALVQKCVDDDEIVKMSQDIAFLMITGMQKSSSKDKWGIINPVNGANVSKKIGQNIGSLKYAWGTVGTKLSGKNLHYANSEGKTAKIIWNTIQNHLFFEISFLGIQQRVFNWYGVSCLSTVMNEWGNESSFNNLYDWLVYQGNKFAKKRPKIEFDEFFIHLPAIAKILHDYNGNQLLPAEKYEYYLNTAPADGGHQYYLNGKKYQSEKPWHSLSLFCPNHIDFEGEYNMIDYMLLYNAYFLIYQHHKHTNDSKTTSYKEKINTDTIVSQIDSLSMEPEQLDSCIEGNHAIRLYPEFNAYFIDLDKNYQVYYHKTNIEPYTIPWGDFEHRRTFIDTSIVDETSSNIDSMLNIEVYHNSADEYVRILQISNYQYIVSDENGKAVLKGTIVDESNACLDISMLQSGFYFLNIYSNKFLVGTFKIIKEATKKE